MQVDKQLDALGRVTFFKEKVHFVFDLLAHFGSFEHVLSKRVPKS
jgi:hypothetical protein